MGWVCVYETVGNSNLYEGRNSQNISNTDHVNASRYRIGITKDTITPSADQI